MTTEESTKQTARTSAAEPDDLVSALTDILTSMGHIGMLIRPVLKTYSSTTVQRIYDSYHDDSGELADRLQSHSIVADLISHDVPEQCIVDAVGYLPEMDHFKAFAARECIEALQHYRRLNWVPTALVPEPRMTEVLTTAFNIVAMLFDPDDAWFELPAGHAVDDSSIKVIFSVTNSNVPVIRHKELFRLIWDRHDESDRIISIVRQRGSANHDALLAVLTSTPAISEGAL